MNSPPWHDLQLSNLHPSALEARTSLSAASGAALRGGGEFLPCFSFLSPFFFGNQKKTPQKQNLGNKKTSGNKNTHGVVFVGFA